MEFSSQILISFSNLTFYLYFIGVKQIDYVKEGK